MRLIFFLTNLKIISPSPTGGGGILQNIYPCYQYKSSLILNLNPKLRSSFVFSGCKQMVTNEDYVHKRFMYRNGSCVECGLCDKTVHVPEDKKTKARINFFKKMHYNK